MLQTLVQVHQHRTPNILRTRLNINGKPRIFHDKNSSYFLFRFVAPQCLRKQFVNRILRVSNIIFVKIQTEVWACHQRQETIFDRF